MVFPNSQLGKLLSVFFWTYGCMQIPAGWLVDRFEVKWVFAAGFFVWSAATAMTGILHGFAAWIVIRVILGIGESVAFPAYSKILGSALHRSRRGFANAAIMAGLSLGPAVGMLVGGTRGWPLRLAAIFPGAGPRVACCGWFRGWRGCRAGTTSAAPALGS